MKYLVKLVQMVIVLAILYPVYYVWDTDRIDNFCEWVKSGMSLAELEALADEHDVTLNSPDELQRSGMWITTVESTASFDDYACVIKGSGNRVAKAQIIKTE